MFLEILFENLLLLGGVRGFGELEAEERIGFAVFELIISYSAWQSGVRM